MIRFFLAICLLIPLVGCLKDERAVESRIVGIITDYRTKKVVPNLPLGAYNAKDLSLLGYTKTNEYGRYDLRYPVDAFIKSGFLAVIDSSSFERPATLLLGNEYIHQKSYRTKNLELAQFGYLDLEMDLNNCDSIKIVIPYFDYVSMVYREFMEHSKIHKTIRYRNPFQVLANEKIMLNYTIFRNGISEVFSETFVLKPGGYIFKKINS
jgi:hypothetical protein